MKRSSAWLGGLLALVLIVAPGCGTLLDLYGRGPRVYGGTRFTVAWAANDLDPEAEHSSNVGMAFLFLLPCDLALDTALLPITVCAELWRRIGSTPEPPSRSKRRRRARAQAEQAPAAEPDPPAFGAQPR